jgi:protein subunit release factor A
MRSDDIRKLAKEQGELEEAVGYIKHLDQKAQVPLSFVHNITTYACLWRLSQTIAELHEFITTEKDEEMVNMAKDDLQAVVSTLEPLEQQLLQSLLPKDPADERYVPVILLSGCSCQ